VKQTGVVAFALRSDASSKPGGDSLKVRDYVAGLNRRGVRTALCHSLSELQATRPRAVHLLNVDLPLENLRYASWARSQDIPVILSTIAHPHSAHRAMYDKSEDRLYKSLRGLQVPPELGLAARERLKLISRRDLSGSLRPTRGFLELKLELLKQVALILPMCSTEQDEISSWGAEQSHFHVVPNALSFPGPSDGATPPRLRTGGLSVGRIEPRKGQLTLARTAAAAGVPVKFVGALNLRHKQYCLDFMQVVQRSPSLSYQSFVPRDALRDLYVRASFHISFSWMEVVSQAELEAASLGCRLALTQNGYTDTYLDGAPIRVDPSRAHHDATYATNVLHALVEGAGSVAPSPSAMKQWDCVTELLRVAYAQVGL
jgi:glycosyltransferase involved in cell wall biosynthesis